MYYDINGVKAYNEMMDDKYKNRKDTENIFPEGITDAEFRKAIIDIFCGVDWYISYPGSQAQVNEEAIEYILQRIEGVKHPTVSVKKKGLYYIIQRGESIVYKTMSEKKMEKFFAAYAKSFFAAYAKSLKRVQEEALSKD